MRIIIKSLHQNYPRYEVWIIDPNNDSDFSGKHAEDCFTYEEANKAKEEYQNTGKGAWITNKDTGEVVS